MKAIHQLVAGFSGGDAISNEARVLQNIFQGWGFRSEIFSEARNIRPGARHQARDVQACTGLLKPDDVLLLHLSTGSELNDLFARLPGRKVIRYHNITPPEFLAGVHEQAARTLAHGRQQAERLAETAELALPASAFNGTELEAMGYRDVRVLPLLLDLDRLQRPPGRRTRAKFQAEGVVTILFVGRCVPNKRWEDLLHAFYYFHRYVEPKSRLLLVGSSTGTEPYQATLMTLIHELELETVDIVGGVDDAGLAAVYRAADLFLCMSEHEGFCAPLLEAMSLDLPVMAYAAAAVPETLDGAGVLFREKQFDLVAEMMGRLLVDRELREAVVRGQRRRLDRYRAHDLAADLRTKLSSFLLP